MESPAAALNFADALAQLQRGELHAFRDPLDPLLPRVVAGCYTIWDDTGRFLYAGMAGRGLTLGDC